MTHSASSTKPAETLPVLDFRRFDGSTQERAEFLQQLRKAAREHGFFYLTGHGIDPSLIDEVLALSRRFFALPEQDKLAIEMINSPHFRGYNRAGFEHTRGKPDWREQVDISAEKTALPADPSAPAWTRLQGPNQWPAALPELKPTTLRYLEEVTNLGIRLLSAFALALGQKADAFAPIYSPAPNQLLKIVRYPGRDREDGDQGVGAHKDSGFLTLLLQDVLDGLQVEGEQGWIDAPPIPGTFVVNIGEILELASDGYLRANVHRVVSPPAGTARLSVPFFLGANLAAEVPLLKLPPGARRRRARPDARPAQPALQGRRPQLPQESSALASRCGAPPSSRSDRYHATGGTRLRLLKHHPLQVVAHFLHRKPLNFSRSVTHGYRLPSF